MNGPTETAKARARCPLWLCGECRGGTECTCLPRPAKQGSASTTTVDSREIRDGGQSHGSRELGARLRAAREAAGCPSSKRLARELGWSQSTVCRLETGMRQPTALNVATMLGFCKVTGPERAAILELIEGDRDGCWVRPHHGLPAEAVPSVLFQYRAANAITRYDPSNLPAIVQTNDYAQADVRTRVATEADFARHTAARWEHRALLFKIDRPDVLCYLHETTLRTLPVDSETRLGQWLYLAMLIGQDRLRVRIVPAEHDRSAIAGEFTLLRFAEFRPVVCTPTETATLILEHHHIHAYERILTDLNKIALSELDSTELIVELAGGPAAVGRTGEEVS